MKPIILCDLDGIVVNLLDEWLRRYNEDYGKNLRVHDLVKFEIHKNVDIGQKMNDYIRGPGLFNVLQPLPGAIEALESLSKDYDIIILSTPSRAPETAYEKLHWCKKYLPFINRRQIMLGARKEIVYGDFMIDDSPEHLANWGMSMVQRGHRSRLTVTIDYPYNRGTDVDFRALDFTKTDSAWKDIERFVRTMSDRLAKV